MTQIKNARLSTAVTAAMGSAVLACAPMSGQAQDANAPAGFSATQTGQVMIVPYYTVNGSWNTSINLTNTSDSALIVKVRFHEAVNSRDIRDFNVMMSPKDVWAGYVTSGGDGNPPVFNVASGEASCTTPEIPPAPGGVALDSYAYTGSNSDGGSQDNSRMNEGYIEFLVIGECQPGEACLDDDDGIGYLITHVDGIPRNCEEARNRSVAAPGVDFPSPVLGNGPAAATTWGSKSGNPEYADPVLGWGPVRSPAPLKGNVTYVNSIRGSGSGTEALHLDSVADPTVSLVTAQSTNWFLEPTIATMPAGLWNVTGLNELEERITWSNVYNEWASNPANNAYTDWVVNFPTKGYHVDQNCNTVQANNNAWRNDGSTIANCDADTPSKFAQDNDTTTISTTPQYTAADSTGLRMWPVDAQLAPFNKLFNADGDGKSLVTYQFMAYDREEGKGSSGPVFSPSPAVTVEMPYETNVIRFVEDATTDPLASNISSYLDVYTAVGDPNATFGWVDIDFSQSAYPDTSGVMFDGLPVYGFALKVRQPNGAPHQIGQMMNHGYGYKAVTP